MSATIQAITQRVSGYWPGVDRQLLAGAYDYAARHHEGQRRLSGDPYIVHPLEVGNILAVVESDPYAVAAGLLHDTVEDTAATPDDLQTHFGPEVTRLVEGVTKLAKLDFASREEEQARNLRKMFLAMAEDLRVIVIKLSDRLHNMRTLAPLRPEQQSRTASETLHIFAPLAHRLGVWRIKWELEDLSLKWLEPGKYDEIAQQVGMSRQDRERLVNRATAQLQQKLTEAGVQARVQGRPKHLYSIYSKMREQQVDFAQIADLNALRVVVATVPDCYAALGVVHALWVPIPDMFADYIAKPKANGYQSLHTKAIGPDGQVLEVQIRTEEMHRQAEYGVAAHWRYKEGGAADARMDEQVAFVRQLLELDSDLSEGHEFMELLKLDLFEDQVFVFTPKGDVIELPAKSGPLDFAYRIHTDIGNHCVGATVNGRRVGLDYQFRNGDIVEITTSPQAAPTHNWLRIIRTSGAKSKVRRYLRAKAREDNIAAGRESLDRAIHRLPPEHRHRATADELLRVAHHLSYPDVDSLLAAIGFGDLETETLISHLTEEHGRPESLVEAAMQLSLPGSPGKDAARPLPVKAGGVSGFHSRLSKCCNPLPGDTIVGYITRGKGLAIHRADCKSLDYHAQREPERIVKLSWSDGDTEATFSQDIELVAVDRMGIFSHITAIVADANVDIRAVSAHAEDNHLAHLHLTLSIHRREDLDRLLARLRSLIDVVSVRALAAVHDHPKAKPLKA
jgi:GTP diphosphokinase / guanosine-3',5'-bis(diphosphate) 3'-diphosphatase